jgi:hypothetical protein
MGQGPERHGGVMSRVKGRKVEQRGDMVELLRTNDFALLSFVRALLQSEGIAYDDFDGYMNILDGNIGAIPRRIMVDEDDAQRARRLLADADLAHVLSPEKR